MDFSVECDVAVVGGGIAGAAAALQSARSGRKTLLIEKTILLGGLAAGGLVYIYLPLCDGNGHQVTFGICEELLHCSMRYGPGKIYPGWKQERNAPESRRLMCRFSPASLMLSLEELLVGENVDIWYDTRVCGAEVTDGRKVSALIVENESGRGCVHAKCVVDASGNAVVLRRAGVPCLMENNYLTAWALRYQADLEKSDFGRGVSADTITTSSLDQESCLLASPELLRRMFGEQSDETYRKMVTYNGVTGETVSRFVRESHRLLLETFKMRYESGRYTRENCYPLKLPFIPQFRKTCCVDGAYVLNTGENARYFEDSIGLAADWRKSGSEYVWEIPFRTLYPKAGIDGVVAAGRCSAARGDAWEITRVIPCAAMTGQVAGLAAAMSVESGREIRELDVHEIQRRLRQLGFPIHRADAGL